MQQPVAAIDCGTNTARLLIGYVKANNIEPILVKRYITRLGGGFTRQEGISLAAKERSLTALIDFADEIKNHGVSRVRGVATSAVRDAPNGKSFCDEIFMNTGIQLQIIDSHEEGLLTLQGVIAGMDNSSGNLLVFDIGGGSTEYMLTLNGIPEFIDSIPLGVVRLTEGKQSIEAMKDKIVREIDALKTKLERKDLLHYVKDVTLVGTAGTATTLAAISMKMTDYDYRKVNNYVLPLAEIMDIYEALHTLRAEERLNIPGLERGREDLILAGILVTIETMTMFGFSQLKVSDFGLLEGVLLSI